MHVHNYCALTHKDILVYDILCLLHVLNAYVVHVDSYYIYIKIIYIYIYIYIHIFILVDRKLSIHYVYVIAMIIIHQ